MVGSIYYVFIFNITTTKHWFANTFIWNYTNLIVYRYLNVDIWSHINLKSENNIVYLEVKDNGSGFNANIDFKNTNTLGLQLVNTLVDQIDGELTYKSEKGKGTQILISFKM